MLTSLEERTPAATRLRRLGYAIAVIDEGGTEAAAERRGVERETLETAIAEVEQVAGVQLLDRDHAGVPTSEGHQFASEVRRAVARRHPRSPPRRTTTLRVGFLPYLGIARLHDFLLGIRRLAPTLEVEVMHRMSGEQIALLRNGHLDAGVLRVVRPDRGLTFEALCPGDPMTAFIAADHPLAIRPVISPADVADQDLIMPSRALGAATFDWWLLTLARAGFQFRRVHRDAGVNANDLIARVLQGHGIAVAMRDFVPLENLGTRVVARPLVPAPPLPQTVLAWSADADPAVARSIAILREAALALRPAQPGDHDAPATRSSLTRRELEILALAAEGLSGPEIASRLGISLSTVRTHFDNVYRKLGTGDRAGAVATAIRQGMLQ
jgi:DNA-binding transcriptional LysR family regulator/DNA-binding CsgD family transcriptional regulator